MGDLNSRRGRVEGLEPRGQCAGDPGQGSRLRPCSATPPTCGSTTQGRATFTMQFDRYEEVPQSIAGEIVAAQT
jgi:elongation factor G